MIRVCFHGAESTGKTTLIGRLVQARGWRSVPEFGRQWAESQGTDFTMDALLAIARGQDAAMRAAAATGPRVLLLDTDPLMTAAWARMLFDDAPAELFGYAKADLYLLFEPDVGWVADGTRFFGGVVQRERFAGLCLDVLVEAAVRFLKIRGDWAARERAAIEAIDRL